MLRSTVLIFVPFLTYDILWFVRFKKSNEKEKNILGKYLKDWPQEIRNEYYTLFEEFPLEKQQDLFAEVHYFLIFYLAKNSMKYFVTEDERKTLLDYLFKESFSDRTMWPHRYPATDAFDRYEKTKIVGGPVHEFSDRICQIIGVDSELVIQELFIRIGYSLKYYTQLFTEDTFSDGEHTIFKID